MVVKTQNNLKCLVCGRRDGIQMHHIIPKLHDKNSKDVIPLCREHHRYMPPFAVTPWKDRVDKIDRVAQILNQKVKGYQFTVSHKKHKYKKGFGFYGTHVRLAYIIVRRKEIKVEKGFKA